MDLFLVAERSPGSKVVKRWLDQDGLDLEGMWKASKEAKQMEGGENTDGKDTEMD